MNAKINILFVTNFTSEGIVITKTVNLGRHETNLLFSLEEREQRVFTFKEAQEILNLSQNSTAKVIFRLKRKGRVKEIERGKYLLIPARAGVEGHWSEDVFVIVDALIDEYYIAFLTAMSYWGLTDQIPRKVLVATPKRKRNLRFDGLEIRFISIDRKRFFGYVVQNVNNHSFKISSIEKTIIDGLLHPEHCNGITGVVKALLNAKDRIDWDKLLNFVQSLKVSAVKRRLGYILELFGIEPEVRKALEDEFKGYRWLDPSYKKQIRSYNKKWGLMLNISPEELTTW